MRNQEFIKKAEEKGYKLTTDRGGKENTERIYKYGLKNADADKIDRIKGIVEFSDVYLSKMTVENKELVYKDTHGWLGAFWDDKKK